MLSPLESTLMKNREGEGRHIQTSTQFHRPVVNSLTIKYIAAIPASRTPLSSETEMLCNRLNSAKRGLSAPVA